MGREGYHKSVHWGQTAWRPESSAWLHSQCSVIPGKCLSITEPRRIIKNEQFI